MRRASGPAVLRLLGLGYYGFGWAAAAAARPQLLQHQHLHSASLASRRCWGGGGGGGWGLTPSRRSMAAQTHRTMSWQADAEAANDLQTELMGRVHALYHTGHMRALVATTGAGGAAAGMLLGVPGASSTILEFRLPYSHEASRSFLMEGVPEATLAGSAPGDVPFESSEFKYCSMEMAALMARAALYRAARMEVTARSGVADCLADLARGAGEEDGGAGATRTSGTEASPTLVGIGCAAAIGSTRPRIGNHEAHIVAFQLTSRGVRMRSWLLHMQKGARTRVQEDQLVGFCLIRALLESHLHDDVSDEVKELFESVMGGEDDLSSDTPELGEHGEDGLLPSLWDGVAKVLEGRASHALILPGNFRGIDLAAMPLPCKCLVFPGSFNPLHTGHVRMGAAAQARWQAEKGELLPLLYEITVYNADKGAIPLETVEDRLEQFAVPERSDNNLISPLNREGCRVHAPVAITAVPLFSQKADLFPGCVFLIGSDTAERIVDPKYYGNSHESMVAALATFLAKGCSFIVGGRVDDSACFRTADDVLEAANLPPHIRGMFLTLTEDEFRIDLSSTEIRNGAST